MSATPEIAGTKPIRVAVEDGKSYWWCACGRSKKQPFCDGSHKGSEFSPMEYKAAAAAEIAFCACKRSGKKPTCDGTHRTLAPPAPAASRGATRRASPLPSPREAVGRGVEAPSLVETPSLVVNA